MKLQALRLSWWLLAAAAVLAFVWALLPDPTAPTKLVRPAQPWWLPEVKPPADLSAAASQVAASALWGKKVLPGAVPAEDTRWAIGGSYVNDGVGTAVIRFASKRPEMMVRKGDSLPSGEVVVEVEIDRVCVAAGKKRECRPVVPVKPSEV